MKIKLPASFEHSTVIIIHQLDIVYYYKQDDLRVINKG